MEQTQNLRRIRKRRRLARQRILFLATVFTIFFAVTLAVKNGLPNALASLAADIGNGALASFSGDGESAQGGSGVPVDKSSFALRLVNAQNPLPAGFSVETKALENGERFDARAFTALQQMLSDGAGQGLNFVVCSGYRTMEKQTQLYNQKVAYYKGQGLSTSAAEEKAATVVARPGTSEHNLGLAADICALNYQRLDDGYAETNEAKWLLANCADYGFILRYPKGKEQITGVIYEPWHFRYVGKAAAREIMASGLCLEEFLALK